MNTALILRSKNDEVCNNCNIKDGYCKLCENIEIEIDGKTVNFESIFFDILQFKFIVKIIDYKDLRNLDSINEDTNIILSVDEKKWRISPKKVKKINSDSLELYRCVNAEELHIGFDSILEI